MTSSLTIFEIADMLRPSAEAIARKLLPHDQRRGNEWHCSGSDSPIGEAIGVVVSGSKQGICCFFGSKRGGDLIELAQQVLGLDKAGAIRWAKNWLGLPATQHRADPDLVERQRIKAEERRQAREAQQAIEQRRKVESALSIWNEAHDHGPGFEYLRHRGIDLAFADAELRSHPGLRHPEGGSFPGQLAG